MYLQSLDSMGLTITDQDVQDYLHTQIQPSNAPIFTPTPSPTLIPQRAEWATQTEQALVATACKVTRHPARLSRQHRRSAAQQPRWDLRVWAHLWLPR